MFAQHLAAVARHQLRLPQPLLPGLRWAARKAASGAGSDGRRAEASLLLLETTFELSQSLCCWVKRGLEQQHRRGHLGQELDHALRIT